MLKKEVACNQLLHSLCASKQLGRLTEEQMCGRLLGGHQMQSSLHPAITLIHLTIVFFKSRWPLHQSTLLSLFAPSSIHPFRLHPSFGTLLSLYRLYFFRPSSFVIFWSTMMKCLEYSSQLTSLLALMRRRQRMPKKMSRLLCTQVRGRGE